MALQVIISQQKGPLPVDATFSAVSSAPMYLEVTGSVWTQTANSMTGIQVLMDGTVLGAAQIFSNANATHRAVVAAYFQIQLTQGQHTLTLKPNPGSTTVSDINDFFSAVIHY